MKFGLVNESTVVTDNDCKAMVAALAVQAKDAAHAWDRVVPTISFYTKRSSAPADRVMLAVLDDPDTAGALGYHDVGPDGRPYAKIFAKLIMSQPGGSALRGSESVSACASHEFLEAFGDPSCLLWDAYNSTRQVAHELGDPVQGDSYEITTASHGVVSVSNYVLPAYFNPWDTKGPWDHMGTLTGPAPKLSKGGYAIIDSASGEKQIFGEVPIWKQDLHGRTAGRLGQPASHAPIVASA